MIYIALVQTGENELLLRSIRSIRVRWPPAGWQHLKHAILREVVVEVEHYEMSGQD